LDYKAVLTPACIGAVKSAATRHHRPWAAMVLGALVTLLLANQAYSDTPMLEMRAQLMSQKGTLLSAEMPGRIDHIALQDGDRFRQGQLLMEFDCSLQQAQLARANAQLLAAENTRDGQERLAELNAIGQVELRNSEAEVLKAQADVTYLQVMVSRCQINAPYDGRVIRFNVREHQSVQAGEPLLEIIDNAALALEVLVPSQWLSWFTPGYRFDVQIEDTARSYPVKLLRTAARVEPVSQTVRALAEMDGDFPELLPGMSGTVIMRAPQ
jgi:membrane fusion protein, multidrug efflux system